MGQLPRPPGGGAEDLRGALGGVPGRGPRPEGRLLVGGGTGDGQGGVTGWGILALPEMT